MPLCQRDIINACEILAEQEELQVAANESFKGACIAFAGALLGGLLGGPIGLGVGGAAGGTLAAYNSTGKFRSVVSVINGMPEREKQKLADAVQKVMGNIQATDIIALIALLNTNALIKEAVVGVIKNCVTQKGLKIL